ncbi:uncharacterized protein LOC116930704 isoform X1 [Daphnia magna]|uniref:uncharacterized protein LOC116930704 isoform X1 n=2 Tax=Daphnia magna TaxID=35525 RepID=UPI001E1BD21A|nr:uncharacterized protein LOC116930704 isoform X1 [Daphnia magna]
MKFCVAAVLLVTCMTITASDIVSPWNAGWSAVIVAGHDGPYDDFNDQLNDHENFPSSDDREMFSTQYIAQDELGQTSFGYAHTGQAATNYRDAWGNQVGNWAFITPEGQQIIVAYIADDQGFRAFSENLPVAPSFINEAPTDTIEVAAARAEHLAAYHLVKNRPVAVIPAEVPNVGFIQSVTDTPEVMLAKTEFMKVFNAIKNSRAVQK